MIKGILLYIQKRKITDGLLLFVKLFISVLPYIVFILINYYIDYNYTFAKEDLKYYGVIIIFMNIRMPIFLYKSASIKGDKEDLSYKDAFITGVWNILPSCIPGVSNIGVSLTSLLFLNHAKEPNIDDK